MDAPPTSSDNVEFIYDACIACQKQIGRDAGSRRAYHPGRVVIFCGACYQKGNFSGQCWLCGATESCAPMHHNHPQYVCRACQWSDQGRLLAEQKGKAERRKLVHS